MSDKSQELERFGNCPHCGASINEGYINCFDCGEIFTMNPVDLIKGKKNNLEAGKDYLQTEELDKIVNNLSRKFSIDNVGVMTWNSGIVVFDGSDPELILKRYNSNSNTSRLASEGGRWTTTLNDFRSLRTDLNNLSVNELRRLQQNFNNLKKDEKLVSQAQVFFNKPKFSNFVQLADYKPYSGLASLLDTIADVRSCIKK